MSKKLASKKLNKKGVLSKRSLVLLSIVGVMVIIGVGLLIYNNVSRQLVPSSITKEDIQAKVTEYINKYKYSDVQMRTMIEVDGSSKPVEFTTFSTSKDMDANKSFIVMDNTLKVVDTLVWEKNEAGSYDVYLSDVVNGVTVKTEQETEPVNMNPWGIVTNVEAYTLHDEFVQYGDIQCYLLYIMGQDEEGNPKGEELYIDSETFAPVGLVSYTQISNKEEIIKDITNEYKDAIGEDITIEDVEATVNSITEYTLLYTFQFTNETENLMSIPNVYLTEDEYVEFRESLSEDKDETK